MVQTLTEEDRRASDGDSGRVTSSMPIAIPIIAVCIFSFAAYKVMTDKRPNIQSKNNQSTSGKL